MSPRIAIVSVPAGPDGVALAAADGAVDAPGVCVQAASSITSGRTNPRARCRTCANLMVSSFTLCTSMPLIFVVVTKLLDLLRDRGSRGCHGGRLVRIHQTGHTTEALHHVDVAFEERLPRRRDRVDAHARDLRELALQRAQAICAFLGRTRERELIEHVIGDE